MKRLKRTLSPYAQKRREKREHIDWLALSFEIQDRLGHGRLSGPKHSATRADHDHIEPSRCCCNDGRTATGILSPAELYEAVRRLLSTPE